MPLATNPKRTVPVWLESDADTPEEARPVFNCRFLTRAEVDEFEAELAAVSATKDYAEAHARLTKLLARGVVGWERQAERVDGDVRPIDYAPDRFDRLLTGREKFELARLMIDGPRMTELDAKKSTSSPISAPASSAPAATAAGEDAQRTTPANP